MDFGKYDNRAAAEDGFSMPLIDPITGDQITDGKEFPAVIVRGVASRTAQAALRIRQKAKMRANKAGDEKARVMEDVHADLCEGAAPFVIGFVAVERDGKPLTTSPEDVQWFFDLTFPAMENTDGEWLMANNPFAKQVAEAAGKQANFLPNAGQG